jgi:hypothetical protein
MKPVMIAEIGSVGQGGDKALWIAQGLRNALPAQMPRVQAIMWFDGIDPQDVRVNTSLDALDAFRGLAMSPLYGGRLTVTTG